MIIFFIQRMMLPINYEKQTEHCPPEQTSGALQDDSAPHKRKVVRDEGTSSRLHRAAHYTQRTRNGGEYGDQQFQDFFPVDFHGFLG